MNDKLKPRTNVLGVGVSSINMDEAVAQLLDARAHGHSGYVCVTGVHGVIESQRDPELKRIHNRSFLTVPDGMPTVWMGREQGFVHMGRVYGPDLMLRVCEATADLGSAKCYDLGVKQSTSTDVSLDSNPLKPKTENLNLKSDAVESNFMYPSQDETGALDLGGGQRTEDGGQKTASGLIETADQITNDSRSSVVGSRSSDKKCFTHFLFGSTPEVLEKLKTNLEARFPGVQIVGTYSPPFRPLNDDEEKALQQIVAACKPDFFWVGLSTPKQERFMASHSPAASDHDMNNVLSDKKYQAARSPKPQTSNAKPQLALDCGIMLGVGAAFDIHAGLLKDAPEWIKNSGLQWFYRLCQEPKRLWRRYFDIVPTFLWLAFLQVMGIKRYSIDK